MTGLMEARPKGARWEPQQDIPPDDSHSKRRQQLGRQCRGPDHALLAAHLRGRVLTTRGRWREHDQQDDRVGHLRRQQPHVPHLGSERDGARGRSLVSREPDARHGDDHLGCVGAGRGGAVSFLGTNTATPFGTVATGTGSGATLSVSVTPADLTLDLVAMANGNTIAITPDASQTQQVNVTGNTGGGVNTAILGMSIKAAGATMQWTQSGSGSPFGYAMIGIPILAASGGRLPGSNIHVFNQAAINRSYRY